MNWSQWLDTDPDPCHCCEHLLTGWIMDQDGEMIDDRHNRN
jgi:hypothetical protein